MHLGVHFIQHVKFKQSIIWASVGKIKMTEMVSALKQFRLISDTYTQVGATSRKKWKPTRILWDEKKFHKYLIRAWVCDGRHTVTEGIERAQVQRGTEVRESTLQSLSKRVCLERTELQEVWPSKSLRKWGLAYLTLLMTHAMYWPASKTVLLNSASYHSSQ